MQHKHFCFLRELKSTKHISIDAIAFYVLLCDPLCWQKTVVIEIQIKKNYSSEILCLSMYVFVPVTDMIREFRNMKMTYNDFN